MLFWEKDNDEGERMVHYFDIENLIYGDPINWGEYQADINKGAPYSILDTKLYVKMLYEKGSAFKVFNSKSAVIKAGMDKKYEKAMAPFKKANNKYWG